MDHDGPGNTDRAWRLQVDILDFGDVEACGRWLPISPLRRRRAVALGRVALDRAWTGNAREVMLQERFHKRKAAASKAKGGLDNTEGRWSVQDHRSAIGHPETLRMRETYAHITPSADTQLTSVDIYSRMVYLRRKALAMQTLHTHISSNCMTKSKLGRVLTMRRMPEETTGRSFAW